MTRSTRRWSPLALFLCLVAVARAADGPTIEQFSPEGTVKGVRQVTARFSEPMVPLGDPRSHGDPFEIGCPEKGTARWIDSRTWSYDFERDLPAGIRCRFRLRGDAKTLAGAAIGGKSEFAFSTGGPSILSSRPYDGAKDVAEDQAFVLNVDAEPRAASITKNAGFAVEGRPERIGVKLLGGAEREAILKTMYPGSFAKGTSVVVLAARQRFPNGAKVSLVWGKGIESKSGVATDRSQVLAFRTRKAFLAEFHCERENRKSACIPVTAMRLDFTAPISWEAAKEIAITGPNGARWSPKAFEESERTVSNLLFEGPFPEEADFQVTLPEKIEDDAGRKLANADRFPLAVKTATFPPLAKFAARFGIVEWKGDAMLPVTLRNLEPELKGRLLELEKRPVAGLLDRLKGALDAIRGRVVRLSSDQRDEILPWLRKVGTSGRDQSVLGEAKPGAPAVKSFTLPKPNGEKAFEVVGIPFDAPGLYVVELESRRLGERLLGADKPMYVPTAALVTNLSVHFKWGLEGSLVWVTTLDRAAPVGGAEVRVQDCKGAVVWEGKTGADGIARVAGLPDQRKIPDCELVYSPEFRDFEQSAALRSLGSGLFVIARTGDDLSFVSSSWGDGIEPWRFQLPEDSGWSGPGVVSTIFDRSLLRAGDTLHMKHVIRARALRGFLRMKPEERPSMLSIRHLGSDQKYDFPLEWDAGGIAETSWAIPKEAKLGAYETVMVRGDREWTSGDLRVEEFRVPLARGIVQLPAAPAVRPAGLPVDLAVDYLAGGGAGGLPVVLRSQIRPRSFTPPDAFDGFTFGNGAVEEGIERRGAWWEEEGEGEGEGAPARPGVHSRQNLVLGPAGTLRAAIEKIPEQPKLAELLAEMEFRDPNGEVSTVAATIPLWPARWMVGLKPDSWMASKDRVQAEVAVVDVAGKRVADAPVELAVLEQKSYSNRKRLVGGFYAYDHVQETRALGTLCSGRTDRRGLLHCEAKPPAAGNLVLQASVTDPDGRRAVAHEEVWVAESERLWFRVRDSDRIDLLPEKKRYEPGETARFQVRMPFSRATALVTVEREGIAEASVVTLSGEDPVVEIPVKESYSPNVFVSVLAVRGRVASAPPTALVDLGRPAFRLGVAEISVGWRGHELRVGVTPERAAYRVREKAKVKIAVRPAGDGPLPAGSEVAVAAVDEGLLELRPNESWKLLDKMMGRRGYGVRTATAQGQVVGKRHYGLKALPEGGGGGRQPTRELFDTLLLWKGRVALDRKGEAEVEIPLNDSLTSFRIVAVATGGDDLFGTGSAVVRSTQDLMLLSGIAPLAREGDEVRVQVTARNTTERRMDARVEAKVEGLGAELDPKTVELAAGGAKVVEWPITVPAGVESLTYEVGAKEPGGASDRLRVTQKVLPVVPVRTFQATLFQLDAPKREPVERPADAIPGRGGVRVTLAPTLTRSLEGVREWMSSYPYRCLEQMASRAIALRDEALWGEVVRSVPSYLDGDGLLKYLPSMAEGSEVLSAYVLSISRAAGWKLPDDVESKVADGLAAFVDGRVHRRSELPTADLSIRKLAALEALSRVSKADAKLVATIAVEPNLWPTSAVIDWWSLLARVEGIPDRDARKAEAEQILRSRASLQGTTMGFSTEKTDFLWWLMVSADSNATRLVLSLVEQGAWKDDVPRILVGALGRQSRSHWDSTLANAWGVLAVEAFAKAFESKPVEGTTSSALAGSTRQLAWKESPAGDTLAFPWPEGRGELALDHAGRGAPWVTVRAQAAIPLKQPLSAGYRVKRTVTPLEPKEAGKLHVGDLVRVRLEVEAQSDMTWVVVSDPIPAGASHMGTRLARDSEIATQGEERKGSVWPAYEERAFDGFRAYYELVPKGSFVVEHTMRLNQAGRFQLPSTRVEALYAPEMFAEAPNAAVEVLP